VFVCTTHAQLILVQKQQKREKERNKKRTKFCFFPPPSPKKRKKCGHRKCRPKGKEVTKGRRTKDGQISHLSLSLFRVAYASIHSSSSRKKRRHRITRPKKARRILPPSRFSQYLRSRDGGVVSSERESTQKKASIRPKRKKNKQTNKGRRHKKSQKSANVAFFSEQSAADF
jgi:hypothetical protein